MLVSDLALSKEKMQGPVFSNKGLLGGSSLLVYKWLVNGCSPREFFVNDEFCWLKMSLNFPATRAFSM